MSALYGKVDIILPVLSIGANERELFHSDSLIKLVGDFPTVRAFLTADPVTRCNSLLVHITLWIQVVTFKSFKLDVVSHPNLSLNLASINYILRLIPN